MHITSQWRQVGKEFDRAFELVDKSQVIKTFDGIPTLDQLRRAEREHGRRIDLTNVGLPCSECGREIGERFASDPDSNLLCWDCAIEAQAEMENGLLVNTDPTRAIISESSLYKKSLADYVINVATGCRHGCKFCYVPSTPAIENRSEMLDQKVEIGDPQGEWGSYLLYRDDLPERLHRKLEATDGEDWGHTDRGRGIVMLSSGTDCYQDRRAAQITRGVVQELVEHEIPVRILTRSPAVTRDLDLFKRAGDYVTVGSSIPSFDEQLVRAMEPNAPPPKARWKALDELQKNGIRVYVSFSPTYPMTDDEFWNMLTHFKALNPEVIFHEPINPRGSNFRMCLEAAQDAGYSKLAKKLEAIQNDPEEWVQYALRHIFTVHEIANEIGGLNIHSWPDNELIKSTTGDVRETLQAMRRQRSPEKFPNVDGESPELGVAPTFEPNVQSMKEQIKL